jgi:NAD(P)-dependent dehydrogenase (short-subunit alcohol dehydrogenase family)
MAAREPLIAVVTGATYGIGRALAEGLAAAGHTVFGCGRSAATVPASGFALERVDVTNDAEVAAWAARIVAAHGPPDLLVNNAALMNRLAPLWKVPAAEFAALIDVNVNGVANTIRHFAPAMVARGRGVIVNMSSGWGRSTSPEVAPYCTSKFAVEGLSKALAQELPRGMACVALNPGVIDTQMLRVAWGEAAASSPDPESWAKRAVPYILGIGPKENGKSLTVPG